MKALHHLEQPCRSGRGLEVAEVGLHRTQRDRTRGRTRRAEHVGEAGQLRGIPDAGRRAVRLDAACRRRICPRCLPGPAYRQPLANRVRRGDPLSSPIAGSAEAEQHCVHPVTVTLGVSQPLQDEEGAPLPHHEPVGTGVEGTRSGRGQGTDLAELDEGRDPHVPVDATGHHRIGLTGREPVHGGSDRSQPGRTGGVRGEVRAPEIEEIGDATGDDVRQLARHRVLGDLREPGQVPLTRLLDDRRSGRLREKGERRCRCELAHHLRELDPLVRAVVLLAADRIAEDHRHPLGIDVPVRPACVQQRRPRRGHRPTLPLIHLGGDLGGNRQSPRHGVPGELPDPRSDPRVGLVGSSRIWVVVQLRVPALRRHVTDAVLAVPDVGPERVGVGCIGHDRGHPYDGDGLGGVVVHGRGPSGTCGVTRDCAAARPGSGVAAAVQDVGDGIEVTQQPGLGVADGVQG